MTDYHDYIITENFLLKEVLEVFEGNNERVALVVNKKGALIGVLSEGDVLRALSGKQDLYSEVISFMRPSFLYLKERDMSRAYQIFKENKITLLPVLDYDFRITSVITVGDIFEWLEDGKR